MCEHCLAFFLVAESTVTSDGLEVNSHLKQLIQTHHTTFTCALIICISNYSSERHGETG